MPICRTSLNEQMLSWIFPVLTKTEKLLIKPSNSSGICILPTFEMTDVSLLTVMWRAMRSTRFFRGRGAMRTRKLCSRAARLFILMASLSFVSCSLNCSLTCVIMSSSEPSRSLKLYCTDIIPKKFLAVSEGKNCLRFTGIFITTGFLTLCSDISILSALM